MGMSWQEMKYWIASSGLDTLRSEPSGVMTSTISNDRTAGDTAARNVASPISGQELMAQRLQQIVTNARLDGQSAYVLLALDLDGFTAISASYGPKAAAQLLDAVGGRLASCLRPTDTIARYGC
jgi:GGDEF domain-containing protein